MPFPDITSKDFSKDDQATKEALDHAVLQYDTRTKRREKLEKMYNSYNGVPNKNDIDSIIKTTGKKSKTKYVRYRLGRSKLKQLHGEFLEIPIKAEVSSVNRDAQNEKMKKYKELLGMSIAKPYIETARTEGYNVFEGMQIPTVSDKSAWNKNNFKLANEIVMGTIIEDKLKSQRIKTHFYQNFIDMTIAAEVFGKNELDNNGEDVYRCIMAKYALYEESVFDPFLDRTPYMGEVRNMYYHEILADKNLKLDAESKSRLREVFDQYDSEDNQGNADNMNNFPVFPVYTIQWKGLETVRVKVSPAKGSDVPYMRILSDEFYEKNKNQIKRDVKAGKYKIETSYREILWTASRINRDIYTKAKKEKHLIQILNKNGKYNVDFDYTGMLFSTVNGYRVSIQEIIYELERIYDDIRFMINKEIRKIKGDTMIYDRAFLPKNKQIKDILHSISEDGIVIFDSSAEGNRAQLDADSNKVGIGAVNLGNNQNLAVLLTQAIDVERVMDRITGMNDSRQGLEKATTTATANTNNVEASRSMTYDMFYFMREYIERVLVKLAEKTKINKTHIGSDSREFVYSDEEIQYMIATKDLMLDNYAVTVTDGRKEQAVLMKLEQMFPQEINAGNLRTRDVAEFFMQENFAKAIKVLDKAHEELAALRQKESRVAQEAKVNEVQTKQQMANDDREDRQQHDKEMELIRNEGKKEVEQMKGAMKATQDFQNNIAKAGMQRAENQKQSIFE
jgi:hypothetical protein